MQINSLNQYSKKWGLKINVNKTKVYIFEKRKQRHNYEWFIDNDKLEIVDNFCYLGIRFYYTGNIKPCQNKLLKLIIAYSQYSRESN